MGDLREPQSPYTADAATLDQWEREALRCLMSPNDLTRADATTFLEIIAGVRDQRLQAALAKVSP